MSQMMFFDDDITSDILARLPPKQLARARCVCKRWRSLTSDHHFLQMHFACNANNSISGFFLRGRVNHTEYFPLQGEAAAAASAFPDPAFSFIPSIPDVDGGHITIESSCNGLIICSRPNRDGHYKSLHFICNPITTEFIALDIPKGGDRYLSLAFDPSKSPYYKVIALGFKIHIYSSETRSWRQADIDSSSLDQFKGLRAYRSAFWNGLLIWIVRDHLLSFDIEREQVKRLPMPDHRPENWNCHYIGESGGFLQMTGYTKEQKLTACFDVLEMGVDCSGWSVLYRIDLSHIKELYPEIQMKVRVPRPGTRRSVNIVDHLALSHVYVVRGRGGAEKGGMLLFGIPGKIMCYDVAKKEFRIVCEVSIPSPSSCFSEYSWYMFYPYNHSLFTL
ncbi:F-box protein At5g07610-like [Ananas comosus]|uniref:F-box protein At5g07610-like n=1 Tax=Ananas comosus TaxID=4615 RepID=A0A6P5EVP0_ANACO|nr:F-box protein At5g07610-like [Ananas comosus]